VEGLFYLLSIIMTEIIIEEKAPQEEIVISEHVPETVVAPVTPVEPILDPTTLAEDLYEKEMQAKRDAMQATINEEMKENEKILEEKVEEHQEEIEKIEEALEEIVELEDDKKAKEDLTKMIKVLADKVQDYQKSEIDYEKMKMEYEHQIKKRDMELEMLREDNVNTSKENVNLRNTTGKVKMTDAVMYFSQLMEDMEKNPSDKGIQERLSDFHLRGVNFVYPELNILDEKKRYADVRKSAILSSMSGGGSAHVKNIFEDTSMKVPAWFVPIKKR